jgi:AcrR family transcriptional regulator
MATSPPVAERPLRADARRNREAILKAARVEFAKHGGDAQMDDIARRAKLGVGTLYRHFPTKDALAGALAIDHFTQVTEIARDAEHIEDPWEAFETMLLRGAELFSRDRAMAEVIALAPNAMSDAKSRTELEAIGARVMRRAQKAGVLRKDARPDDIGLIMCGVGATASTGRFGPTAWRRHLRIALDGLRTSGPTSKLPAD